MNGTRGLRWGFGVLLGIGALTPAAASAKEYALNPVASGVQVDGVIALVPEEVDITSPDFSMILAIRNDSDVPLLLHTPDFRCLRGDFEAPILGSHFGIGEKWLDLLPNETKRVEFTCEHGPDVKGDLGIAIPVVVTNPTGDGRTEGEPILEDIVYRLREVDVERDVQRAGKQVACLSYRRPASVVAVAPTVVADGRPLAIPGGEPPPPAGEALAVPAVPAAPPPPPPPAATIRPRP